MSIIIFHTNSPLKTPVLASILKKDNIHAEPCEEKKYKRKQQHIGCDGNEVLYSYYAAYVQEERERQYGSVNKWLHE